MNIDEDYTYEQLRNWTSEFVDDVYYLRNEIVHGGTFEGPSFDRFVERLDSYLKRAILIVLVALTSKTCIPDDIDELLAWIWYKNPDKKIADVRKT
ncbi:hypothetical protein DCC62_19070 [candidate division KSB1 bacterium]|nr:MAG: hypothetical protein DCC62_19070 [candidate division KSB1 bacterium]